MTNCLSPDCQMGGLGCDNMTVILVCFLHGKSWEEYCEKIAASLEPNIESFASSLSTGNGMVTEDIDDDADAMEERGVSCSVAVTELVKPGDTTESVAKINQNEKNSLCTAPQLVDQSPVDSKSSIIREVVDEILNDSPDEENSKVDIKVESSDSLDG